MAELAIPLLSDHNSGDLQTSPQASKYVGDAASVDDAVESSVDAAGCAQFLQALLVSFAWAFDAQQTFINVFTDAQPPWHSTTPTPAAGNNPCNLPADSWAWDRPAQTSVISEWSLQCASPTIIGLPASAFFAGCLAGGFILSTLADTCVGRKMMLFWSCFVMAFASLLTSFSGNVWVYAAARFICGFARATVGTCALVLSTELVGRRWKDNISIAGFFSFSLGFLSLPAMAYVNRESSWRTLYLSTSFVTFLYSILIYFFVPESPRWLLVKGAREEAQKNPKENSVSNRSEITSSFSALSFREGNNNSNSNMFSAMNLLWEKKWAFRRLLAVMAAAFGIGTVYYGMPLGVGNLSSNLYISVTMNALAEVPSSMITFFLIGVLDRRKAVLGFTAASGGCSALCVLVEAEGLRMAAEVSAFFSGCTALNVVLIYSIELFPTCVRNSAIAMVRQALVLGGVWAPVLVAAGGKQGLLSFGVFGVVIACGGLFVLVLPETRGVGICDTMEEEEHRLLESTSYAALA